MKKKLFIFIIIFSICLCGSIITRKINNINQINESEIVSENGNKKEIEKSNKEQIINDEIKEKDIEQKDNIININEDKANSSNSDNIKQNVKEHNNISYENNIDNSNENVEKAKKEIWEELRMTKDEYYNQPMYKWEKVDFSNKEECLKYGDNYEPYLNGEVSYNCSSVTSMSGKYLGEMFYTEKLQ